MKRSDRFQSTLSSQRVTFGLPWGLALCKNFNPHSPRREWREAVARRVLSVGFQSTLSSQRVTFFDYMKETYHCISIHTLLAESDNTIIRGINMRSFISIHTLLAESDVCKPCFQFINRHFNPHSPRREWRSGGEAQRVDGIISIHTLLAESDGFFGFVKRVSGLFQSTLSSQRVTML